MALVAEAIYSVFLGGGVGVKVILLFRSVCRILLFVFFTLGYSVLFIDARSWTASPDLSDSSSRLSSDAGEPPNKKLCVTKQRGEWLFY